MAEEQIQYGTVKTAGELGRLVRRHRKQRRVTLETVSGLGNLSMRFLSEFERGKETAELGKALHALRTLGLEISVHPRRAPTGPSPAPPRPATANDDEQAPGLAATRDSP